MPTLYLVIPRASGGGQISAADINQLVNTLTGNQNTSASIKNTDPIAYTLQLQNTDPAGKALLIYGPDGTTVLNRVQGNGVVASPDGTAAAPIVTTTHPQTLTNKTFTGPVVNSGGLQVAAGNVGIGTVPLAQQSLRLAGTTNAVGGSAISMTTVDTLVAQANNDVLYGLLIQPTYNDNAKTGVVHYPLSVGRTMEALVGSVGSNSYAGSFAGDNTFKTLVAISCGGLTGGNIYVRGAIPITNSVTGEIFLAYNVNGGADIPIGRFEVGVANVYIMFPVFAGITNSLTGTQTVNLRIKAAAGTMTVDGGQAVVTNAYEIR